MNNVENLYNIRNRIRNGIAQSANKIDQKYIGSDVECLVFYNENMKDLFMIFTSKIGIVINFHI